MKKTILLAVATCLIAPSIVLGNEPKEDFCVVWHDFAYNVASLRQDNAPMPDVMAWVTETTGDDLSVRQMVINAYNDPLMLGDEYKKLTVEQFANDAAAQCYREGW